MTERFVSPCRLPTPLEGEILDTLIEEAAEAIQRATKAQRFGVDEIQPGQELSNCERLSLEVGDFLGMVRVALEENLLSEHYLEAGSARKIERFEKYRQFRHEPEHAQRRAEGPSPQDPEVVE